MNCLSCSKELPEKLPGTRGPQASYCSVECRPSYKPSKPRVSDCQACGQTLAPSRTKRNKRYCNRVCASQVRQLKAKANRQRNITCDHCGLSFTAAGTARRFCSKECRYKSNLEKHKAEWQNKAAEIYPGGIKTKICRWCNEEMKVSARKSYAGRLYHEDCSREAQAARYRIKTVKRQKKTNPQRISPEQVVREYGSDCNICSEPIDLELPRTHRFGLTVDHHIPVNKGGTDDMSNLRPAHWICNVKKSDKMPETDNA